MPAILLNLIRPLAPYLLGALILVGGGFYIVTLRHHLQSSEQQNAALAAQNAANAAAIADYQAQQQKYAAALGTLDAQTLATGAMASRITAKINAAPASDDGPVAPVLAQALDGLRAMQGDAP